MNKVKQIIKETVKVSDSKDERRFIAKHRVKTIDRTKATNSQKSGETTKDRSRRADKLPGEDEMTYESYHMFESKISSEMKLKDGSTVKLSEKDQNALRNLFKELSSVNKKKMEEKMVEDRGSFDEILQFAKEAM